MIIAVGSKNPTKVSAVELEGKSFFESFQLFSYEVPTGVNDQPHGLDETFLGARQRAEKAYKAQTNCTISFGIEDGCLIVPGEKTKKLNICCVCLWDGDQAFFGTSSAFQLPSDVSEIIDRKSIELSEALYETGYTNSRDIGSQGGAIGIITKEKLVRRDYTRQALLNVISTWEMEKENDLPR